MGSSHVAVSRQQRGLAPLKSQLGQYVQGGSTHVPGASSSWDGGAHLSLHGGLRAVGPKNACSKSPEGKLEDFQ